MNVHANVKRTNEKVATILDKHIFLKKIFDRKKMYGYLSTVKALLPDPG